MKRLLITSILAVLGLGIASAQTIYGHMFSSYTPGIYSIPVSGTGETCISTYSTLDLPGGASVFADGYFYSVRMPDSSYGDRVCYYLTMDENMQVTSGEYMERLNSKLAITDIPTAMAWNSLSGKIYGCYYADSSKSSFDLGEFSQVDGTATHLASLPQQLVTMAFDPNGTLYAIGVDGTLYKVSMSGNLTEVCSTGVSVSAKYAQGSAFDPATGDLYWMTYTKGMDCAFYKITSDGTVTKIADVDNKYASLYIPEPAPVDGAPADVADFSAIANGFENEIAVSFTLPSQTIAGADMLGAVKYQILLDGEVKVDTQGGPGNSVSEVLAAERGEHSVVLKISNTAGNGHKCAANVFVGEDDPMPVSNLQLSVDGNDVSLTWEAPTVGKNGGNFNTDTLVYDVVRNPGEVAVATGITDTEFTETIAATSLTKYSYSVTARSGELSSDPVESDSFILGDGYAIPYSEDFTDVKSFDDIFYTVVDANNDNSTWSLDTYGERAKYSYSSRNAADDWLFTAPLQLNEGYSYDLNYTFTTTSWSDGEIFGSFIGTAPDPEAMTTAIVDTKDFVKNTTFEEGGSFKISDSGTYYIGFHITTQANSYHAYLDNISVVVDNESRLNSINVKGLTVSTAKGEIIVNADNNTNLAIYAMDGITVANGNVCGTKSYPVSRGFYLVKANDKVYKLSVK